ncbi:DJ-1 family glyoxalase III [Aeromonas simiae]|uniref:DJ-1 family glyoxalase III n=1 Tax=Aeromonas simiae TaxID=218936 RepID=UPI00266CB625|nr:DJ-1 family glyoxalase III [Aeromonas simiae]MDO2947150.1 DJ-1/PfpI family protein [Aeromonas simiae]MDO2950762.1 DJ-1/PfpI family protein [Aeromonas simiae]MDO2954256.1 DJ-1/PfpI family protein [Aeromonas simiae]
MHAVVLVAPGSEEIETVTLVDVLVRGGVQVTLASCAADGALQITASRGVKLVADCHIGELPAHPWDLVAIPGGVPGSEAIRDCPAAIALLRAQAAEGRWRAALCAAPALVLAHHDLLGAAKVTSHPGFWEQLPATQRSRERVVVDEATRLITSQGPGTSIEFVLAILEQLAGPELAHQVAAPMVL